MFTATGILAIIALVATVASAMAHCPLWIGVIVLCVIELVRVLPPGK